MFRAFCSDLLGRSLGVILIYLLVTQATMAAVGMSMSSGAASLSGQPICSIGRLHAAAPSGPGDTDHGNQQQDCPFCLMASRLAGGLADLGSVPPVPTVLLVAGPVAYDSAMPRVSSLRRLQVRGLSRAPPAPSI